MGIESDSGLSELSIKYKYFMTIYFQIHCKYMTRETDGNSLTTWIWKGLFTGHRKEQGSNM